MEINLTVAIPLTIVLAFSVVVLIMELVGASREVGEWKERAQSTSYELSAALQDVKRLTHDRDDFSKFYHAMEKERDDLLLKLSESRLQCNKYMFAGECVDEAPKVNQEDADNG